MLEIATTFHCGIKAVADANKNTFVVLSTVGAVLIPCINHPNIKAVMSPGLAGQEPSNSLADAILGKVNPSGRFPYTITKKHDNYNVHSDPDAQVNHSEKLLVGYRWFYQANVEPLFPFGDGLSYTKFDHSRLKVKAKKNKDSVTNIASFSAKDSGEVDGAAVVEAYVSFPESPGELPKLLRGFEKVNIKSGK
ncbi:hypothetical protein [Parasitella parasitica]|uniref:beta-glucosidase n=1 Tax=Parasitella parasitica TaxID=35722 RepID=A0A0B7MXS8_9FUNG|nr:hypothetical protein [Parasitella parasitica]